jgi:pimeloyl-ACP methyl ester carboxylesterase
MIVDLVQVTAADGLRLDGILELPAEGAEPTPAIDAWVCIHGTGSNFYSSTLLAGIAPRLLAFGGAVLRANTRGHDLMCTAATSSGRRWQGAAYERVDESPLDLAAWVEFLNARGFSRIGLLGHSLGAVKAIYTLAQQSAPRVAGLVAVSPPRLSYSYFCHGARGDEFKTTFAAAEEHVRGGRGEALMEVKFPLPYVVSAAGYVNRYGPDERYNVLTLLDRVAVPTLVTYGSREVQADLAFVLMPEAVEPLSTPANSLQVAVIAGGDHQYTGVHGALAARIETWLRRQS